MADACQREATWACEFNCDALPSGGTTLLGIRRPSPGLRRSQAPIGLPTPTVMLPISTRPLVLSTTVLLPVKTGAGSGWPGHRACDQGRRRAVPGRCRPAERAEGRHTILTPPASECGGPSGKVIPVRRVIRRRNSRSSVPPRVARAALQLDETGFNGNPFHAQTGRFGQGERGRGPVQIPPRARQRLPPGPGPGASSVAGQRTSPVDTPDVWLSPLLRRVLPR
jgi:hypothetical protein